MNSRVPASVLVTLALLAFAGCGAQSKLTYSALPAQGSEGAGFPFVVPRTVIKVTPTTDKSGATDGVSFITLPMATTSDKQRQLPSYLATDSSSNGWSLTPTTVSSVTYVDDLIISGIGTQVTDNRKDAIDVLVTAASLAGAFAKGKTEPDCAKDVVPLRPFVIETYEGPPRKPVPDVACWEYRVDPVAFNPVGMRTYPVSELGAVGTVTWFPIPACKAYKVSVYQCADKDCTSDRKDLPTYSTTLSVSDGTQYHRIPLPSKGKVSLHTDFCGADVTNESVATSDWGLLKQLLTDVKTEKSKK